MPKVLLVVLIVIGSIIALWLLTVFATLIILAIYNHQIKRNRMSINIILAQKYDVAGVLAKFLLSNQVELPEEIISEFNLMEKPDFNYFNTFERKSIGTRINEIINDLTTLARENNFEENSRYQTLKNSIEDVEKQYKHVILTYNNKVGDYNYWVRFIPFRLVSKIFNIKQKKIINEK